jgi:four helix bundle protein
MQSFRRLDVWRKAHALALNVRRVTRGFSRGEFASLRSQIRSAESVPFNIVEGCDANSRKEFARYREISIKSNFELEYQLQLAYDHCALGDRNWRGLTAQTVEVRRMTCGLRASVRAAAAGHENCRGPQSRKRRATARRTLPT